MDLESIMRISLSGQFKEEKALDCLSDAMVRASGAVDFSDLRAKLFAVGQLVVQYFTVIVGEPAAIDVAHRNNRNEIK